MIGEYTFKAKDGPLTRRLTTMPFRLMKVVLVLGITASAAIAQNAWSPTPAQMLRRHGESVRAAQQMSVSLSQSVQSPAPLGTVITWSAAVSNANPGVLSYRFRVRPIGSDFRTVVDYGPNASLDWNTIEHEGSYEIEVSVKNNNTGDQASAAAMFWLTSLVTGDAPVLTPTSNPLVFIYSAPACPAESRMRVQFQSTDGVVQSTPYRPCNPLYSMNFYLAGMRSNTLYTAQHMIDTGAAFISGPPLTLTTQSISVKLPAVTMLTQAAPAVDGILLQCVLNNSPIATDLSGNIVWYGPGDLSILTRPQAGGTFLGIGEDIKKDPSQQFFREFDMAGITRAETNAARINEQLAAMGVHGINAFHHEARKLPDGKYLVLANSERLLTDVQGSGAVDVIGDTILALDSDLQVVWAWDSFDHLDPHRMAVLGETCTITSNGGCAPWYLAATANDWLHGNSLQLTPDGGILYSTRHQDWLVKIDYQNGAGGGNILWRLGKDGDFQISSSDPSPWFSHQHDANFDPTGSSLSVYDDGNTRAASDPSTHSRGQVLQIDEPSMTATLTLNADLGVYSRAVGSAQRLSNGNYHFDSGFILDSSGKGIAQSVEVNASGDMVYGLQVGTVEYRSFRMRDLYTAP